MKELLEGLPRVDVLGCLVLMFGAAVCVSLVIRAFKDPGSKEPDDDID